MIAASSFNGINGAVWGYDVARHDGLTRRVDRADHAAASATTASRSRSIRWPRCSRPASALFGTAASRRFPLLPGSHVVCATKDITVSGPTAVWSAIALAIAEHRDRDSSLFIEDVGHDIPGATDGERENMLHARMEHIVDSVVLCGEDQDVKYKEIFVGFKMQWVPAGDVGCALTCAPYLVLAKNAAPDPAAGLLDMSLSEWEAQFVS